MMLNNSTSCVAGRGRHNSCCVHAGLSCIGSCAALPVHTCAGVRTDQPDLLLMRAVHVALLRVAGHDIAMRHTPQNMTRTAHGCIPHPFA